MEKLLPAGFFLILFCSFASGKVVISREMIYNERNIVHLCKDCTAGSVEEAMRNRYYKHIGRQIGRNVRDAIRSGNLENIGRAIDSSVQEITSAGNEVLEDLKNAGRRPPYPYDQNGPQGNGPAPHNTGSWQPPKPPVQPVQPRQPVYENPTVRFAFRTRMPGSVSGLVCAAIGLIFGIPLLILDIVGAIIGAIGYMALSDIIMVISVLAPMTVAFMGLSIYGFTQRRRARRFERYREAMGSAAFCAVAKLADAVGETQERTKKDLKKMIASGACPQGHLDHAETCFMVDNKTYSEYLEAERDYTAREQAAREEEQKKQADPKEAELDAVRKEGSEYLQQIRTVNDALPGEVISQKLDRLENVTARIFECVRQHPEKLPDIRRFMRYYMPTTLKLVKSYQEFEGQPVQGDNITKAKAEIEHALDMVNAAFENLLDTLFADDALDVSSDISTLETMLKQEGLTGSDFAKAPDDRKLS